MERVVVEAPATSANLGSGFDVFAIALERPRDRIAIETRRSAKQKIEIFVGDSDITTKPARNASGAVVHSIAKKFKIDDGLSIRISKRVPVGIGLGSSGASSAGAAMAMNHLYDLQMDFAQLIAHAGQGERAVSGTAHLDNVAASILGGFVIVRQNGAPVKFKPPEALAVVAVTPEVRLPERKTEYSRSLVPRTVKTSALVTNVSRASTVVAGFAKGDIEMIGEGMEDVVVEPARAAMVHGYVEVRKAAKVSGASGVCLSGAGPTMVAFVDRGRADPRAVLDSMVKAFRSRKVEAKGFVTSIGDGGKVVESF